MRPIDADELLKRVDEERQYLLARGQEGAEHILVNNFHVLIDNAPTIERPQGEWIKGREISRTMIGNNIEHIDYKDYTCSNCGLVLDYLLYNHDGSPFYKFCPNCGADMRGGKR